MSEIASSRFNLVTAASPTDTERTCFGMLNLNVIKYRRNLIIVIAKALFHRQLPFHVTTCCLSGGHN